jgi:sucrose-phosphate synthase
VINDQLHIQLFSIHGLVRSNNLELGRDADTGGQVLYVIELAKELSKQKRVRRVDLVTRLISDKRVSDDYSISIESVTKKFQIVRIQCGGKKYIRKELLWPHLDEFVDKTIKYIKKDGAIPDIVHGHYGDAGYVAMNLSEVFGIPFIFTGHSLGRNKKLKLISDGMKEEDIVKKYNINLRIDKEEDILKKADLIVTSTNQEISKQYGLYTNKSLPKFRIIPPGLDIEKFYPYYHDMLPESKKDELHIHAHASILQELNRFFLHPDKPLILTLCRPDKRKNLSGLITAFGEDLELQAMANLAIFAGIRKDIATMQENERLVLTDMLLEMDKYDLYGKMAIPKKHNFELEVPELYRATAEKKGVFVNPALIEPFGLTLLEASACGLPIVATSDGGPRDIVANCKNGILVDPRKTKELSQAIKKVIGNPELWESFSKKGIINVRKHYTWRAHVLKYLREINELTDMDFHRISSEVTQSDAIGKKLHKINYFFISDIDHTLIGENNPRLSDLINMLEVNKEFLCFGVATGRTIDSTVKYLGKYEIPFPDVIIASVGSEIYYGKQLIYDKGWETHISFKWNRDKIVETLKEIDFLNYQEEETQRKFKISYYMKPGKDRLAKIHHILMNNKCKYNLIYSHNQFLDILPYRVSKGKAMRYLSYKWEIPLENFLVSGDSGNDEDMLRGEPLGIVVKNHDDELNKLKGHRNIYFAVNECSAGIIEGIEYYGFLEKARSVKKM